MISYKKGQQLKLDFKGEDYTLFLKNAGYGGVSLMAKHDGVEWFILTIKMGKPITLHSSCPREFIIPVDKDGIPIVSREDDL